MMVEAISSTELNGNLEDYLKGQFFVIQTKTKNKTASEAGYTRASFPWQYLVWRAGMAQW